VKGVICGFGPQSYELAIEAIAAATPKSGSG
jgi:3-dehydroquinate dehydratase